MFSYILFIYQVKHMVMLPSLIRFLFFQVELELPGSAKKGLQLVSLFVS